ncbi:MAG: cytochrome C [Gallionellales bacterium RBG_16_57_15]|nr:MAG: cytochrome C [Gallionellales bacterium RBG_16_57_15]
MNSFLKITLLFCLSLQAWATEAPLENIRVATDVATVERGADALMDACHSCHSMKYIKYRDLLNFGMDKQKVESWRGDQPLDAPMLAQMSESDAVQAFGKAPPDLSLMTKTRNAGASYVYSYLTGYYLTADGMPGNRVYPETKMPDSLGIIGVTDAAQRGEIQGKARDIVSFLAWAADPHDQERHRLGYYVLGYLFVLTFLLYLVKNQVWSRLNKSSTERGAI